METQGNQGNLELPPTFIQQDIRLKIQGMTFDISNEFKQDVISMVMDTFIVEAKQSEQSLEAEVTMGSFDINDNWTLFELIQKKIDMKKYQTKLLRFASGRRDKDGKKVPAMQMKYIADTTFKVCPFKADIKMNEAVTIVPIIPVINELQRTMNAAMSDETYDFSYIQKKLTKQTDEVKEVEKKVDETAPYVHSNADVTMFINAPVFKFYENIYDVDSPYLEINLGQIKITSDLIEYRDDVDYSKAQDPEEVYDIYQLSMTKMYMSLKRGSNSTRTQDSFEIIHDISFDIEILQSLAQKHANFPNQVISINFEKEIQMTMNLKCFQEVLRLKDQLMIDMG